MSTGKKTRVLVVGLDGCTFKVLDKYIRWGNNLGFFKYLIENGVVSNLKVFYPCLSPMEWACFSTGKSPAELGIFGLYDIKSIEFSPKIFNSYKLGTFFWEILGEFGIRVGIMNIPATYPPKKVNGFLITGLLTPPNKTYYYPPEIGPLLMEENYKIDFELGGSFGIISKELKEKDKFLEELVELVKIRKNTLLKLLKYFNNNIDFVCINFKEVDSVQHVFWNELDKVFRIYKEVEKATIEIYKYFTPDIIILMSDHGFHSAARKYVYLNVWLEKKGYLKRKKRFKDIIKWKIFNILKNIVAKSTFIRNLIPESFKKYSEREFTFRSIDTSKSLAFCDRWGIYLTREEDQLVSKLKKELMEITDPENGRKIFSKIFIREELYKGKYIHKFPKIILIPSEGYKILPHFGNKIVENRFTNLHLSGEHEFDLNGIFICYGKGVKRGVKLSHDIYINDLAPTILYIYGIPIPTDMDGVVIKEIFDENSIFTQRLIQKINYEKLRIKQKIRDLKKEGLL